MRFTLGITAALVSCAAAASSPVAEVYILPSSQDDSSTPAISREVARLILLQRLAPIGKGPSINELPDDVDTEEVITALNRFGKVQPALFTESETDAPSQLVVMLENMSEEQLKETGDALKMSPAFTIPDVPSSKAHELLVNRDFYNAGVTKEHQCSIGQVVNPFEKECWSGKSTVAKFDVAQDVGILEEVTSRVSKLAQLAQVGEMETIIMLLPLEASVKSGLWSSKTPELRRRQAEQPIVSIDETENKPAVTFSESSHPVFVSSKNIPACFDSKESCANATGDCSKHGSCVNKYAKPDGSDGKSVCYTCYCKSTRSEGKGGGSVTHWAGATCAKKDISVPFWLFAGFTLAMVGILSLAIGLLFSVGEEKLPGVIGAGVSRSK